MIKVNLIRNMGLAQSGGMASLGGGEAVSPELRKQFVTKFLFMLLFPTCLYTYELFHISALKSELSNVDARIQTVEAEKAKYGDAAPKVEQYNKEKKRIDEELDVVRSLAKIRLREVKSLDLLQGLTPQLAWLQKVSIDGNAVKVVGYARTDETFTKLIKNLEDSAAFSRVEPKGTKEEMLSTGPAKKFDLEFQIGQKE